jgi:hypothetical protein
MASPFPQATLLFLICESEMCPKTMATMDKERKKQEPKVRLAMAKPLVFRGRRSGRRGRRQGRKPANSILSERSLPATGGAQGRTFRHWLAALRAEHASYSRGREIVV